MEKRVIYYPGCFANYYNPEIGRAFFYVMERNGFEVIISSQLCCGMPMMANANLKGAERNFRKIVEELYRLSEGKYPILTTCPSCNMMLKKEGKEFFGDDKADYVSLNVKDASEFLVYLDKNGELDRRFGRLELRVLYHNPCHMKVQGKVEDSLYLIRLIPGVEVVGANYACCGMGGSYGMKDKNFQISRKIAQRVWELVKEKRPDVVVTECGGCGLQIKAGTGVKVLHPLELLKQAYEAAVSEAA